MTTAAAVLGSLTTGAGGTVTASIGVGAATCAVTGAVLPADDSAGAGALTGGVVAATVVLGAGLLLTTGAGAGVLTGAFAGAFATGLLATTTGAGSAVSASAATLCSGRCTAAMLSKLNNRLARLSLSCSPRNALWNALVGGMSPSQADNSSG